MLVTRHIEFNIPVFDCIFCGQTEDGLSVSCGTLEQVWCETCGAAGPKGRTKEEAISKWNTRIPQQEKVSEKENLDTFEKELIKIAVKQVEEEKKEYMGSLARRIEAEKKFENM